MDSRGRGRRGRGVAMIAGSRRGSRRGSSRLHEPSRIRAGHGIDAGASASVTTPARIIIDNLYNLRERLEDVADANLDSTVVVEIGTMMSEKEFEFVEETVWDINDNLQRPALEVTTESVGKDVKGLGKRYMGDFRKTEKQSKMYKEL